MVFDNFSFFNHNLYSSKIRKLQITLNSLLSWTENKVSFHVHVWKLSGKFQSEELCTQKKIFVINLSLFEPRIKKLTILKLAKNVRVFDLSRCWNSIFAVTKDLVFPMITSIETAYFWWMLKKSLFWYLQEVLDSPEKPKSVYGKDLSRHSNHFSPEERAWFLLWKYLSKKSKLYLWKNLQLKLIFCLVFAPESWHFTNPRTC